MHDVTRAVLFSPATLIARLARGTAKGTVGLWRWVTDADTAAAYSASIKDQKKTVEELNKLQKMRERRDVRVQNRTGVVLLVAAVLTVVGWWGHVQVGAWTWQAALVAVMLTAIAVGGKARVETGEPTPLPLLTPKSETKPWGGSLDGLQQALADAGLIKPDQAVGVIEMPHKVGRGVAGVAQLPSGLSVAQCVSRKDRIASGLAVDSTYLQLSKGANDGQLKFWAPLGDPFKNNKRPLPLINETRWNAWKPAPFGFTADDKTVYQRLMYSNLLVGSIPGGGKTYAARCAVAPYLLDPGVRIYVANGKFDGAWAAAAPFAVRYVRGRSDEHAAQVNEMLAEVQQEMDRRFSEHMGNASKLTESMGLAPIVVVVDELQNYTTNSTPTDEPLRGKKATLGQWIDYRLVDIVKNGRAAGVILILITQRPSEESLSTELRSQVGTRLALRTMDFQSSNMILGQVSKRGIDASELDPRHKGVGIYAPDMEEDLLDESLGAYPTIRTFECDDDSWAVLCARALELRRQAGEVPADVEDTLEIPTVVEEVMPVRVTVIDRVRQVWPDGRDRMSTAALASALGMETAELTRALKEEGILTEPLWIDRKTQRGLSRADLEIPAGTV